MNQDPDSTDTSVNCKVNSSVEIPDLEIAQERDGSNIFNVPPCLNLTQEQCFSKMNNQGCGRCGVLQTELDRTKKMVCCMKQKLVLADEMLKTSKEKEGYCGELKTTIQELEQVTHDLSAKNMTLESMCSEYECKLSETMQEQLKFHLDMDAMKTDLDSYVKNNEELHAKTEQLEKELIQYKSLTSQKLNVEGDLAALQKDIIKKDKELSKMKVQYDKNSSLVIEKDQQIKQMKGSFKNILKTVIRFGTRLQAYNKATKKEEKIIQNYTENLANFPNCLSLLHEDSFEDSDFASELEQSPQKHVRVKHEVHDSVPDSPVKRLNTMRTSVDGTSIDNNILSSFQNERHDIPVFGNMKDNSYELNAVHKNVLSPKRGHVGETSAKRDAENFDLPIVSNSKPIVSQDFLFQRYLKHPFAESPNGDLPMFDDGLDITIGDLHNLKQQVCMKNDQLAPLSPLPPTPPPNNQLSRQKQLERSNGLRKALNMDEFQSFNRMSSVRACTSKQSSNVLLNPTLASNDEASFREPSIQCNISDFPPSSKFHSPKKKLRHQQSEGFEVQKDLTASATDSLSNVPKENMSAGDSNIRDRQTFSSPSSSYIPHRVSAKRLHDGSIKLDLNLQNNASGITSFEVDVEAGHLSFMFGSLEHERKRERQPSTFSPVILSNPNAQESNAERQEAFETSDSISRKRPKFVENKDDEILTSTLPDVGDMNIQTSMDKKKQGASDFVRRKKSKLVENKDDENLCSTLPDGCDINIQTSLGKNKQEVSDASDSVKRKKSRFVKNKDEKFFNSTLPDGSDFNNQTSMDKNYINVALLESNCSDPSQQQRTQSDNTCTLNESSKLVEKIEIKSPKNTPSKQTKDTFDNTCSFTESQQLVGKMENRVQKNTPSKQTKTLSDANKKKKLSNLKSIVSSSENSFKAPSGLQQDKRPRKVKKQANLSVMEDNFQQSVDSQVIKSTDDTTVISEADSKNNEIIRKGVDTPESPDEDECSQDIPILKAKSLKEHVSKAINKSRKQTFMPISFVKGKSDQDTDENVSSTLENKNESKAFVTDHQYHIIPKKMLLRNAKNLKPQPVNKVKSPNKPSKRTQKATCPKALQLERSNTDPVVVSSDFSKISSVDTYPNDQTTNCETDEKEKKEHKQKDKIPCDSITQVIESIIKESNHIDSIDEVIESVSKQIDHSDSETKMSESVTKQTRMCDSATKETEISDTDTKQTKMSDSDTRKNNFSDSLAQVIESVVNPSPLKDISENVKIIDKQKEKITSGSVTDEKFTLDPEQKSFTNDTIAESVNRLKQNEENITCLSTEVNLELTSECIKNEENINSYDEKVQFLADIALCENKNSLTSSDEIPDAVDEDPKNKNETCGEKNPVSNNMPTENFDYSSGDDMLVIAEDSIGTAEDISKNDNVQNSAIESQEDKLGDNSLQSKPLDDHQTKKKAKSKNARNKKKGKRNFIKKDPSKTVSQPTAIESALEVLDQIKFSDLHYKKHTHNLLCALVNPSNAASPEEVLLPLITYLSASHRNPFIPYMISNDPADLLPLIESCIVTCLIDIEAKKKPHLTGLLKTTIVSLFSVTLKKRKINEYGLASLCRVLTFLCKKMSDIKTPFSLCCDLLKIHHEFAPFLIASIVGVWPEVLKQSDSTSDQESLLMKVIAHALLKKPKIINQTLWKQCTTVLNEFCNNPKQSIDINKAKDEIIDFIQSMPLGKEDDEYSTSLVIIAVNKGWEWVENNLTESFFRPTISYLMEEKDEDSHHRLSVICNIFVDIGNSFEEINTPVMFMTGIVTAIFAENSDYPLSVQESLICGLLRLFIKRKIVLPKSLKEWLANNQDSISPAKHADLVKAHQWRISADSDAISIADFKME